MAKRPAATSTVAHARQAAEIASARLDSLAGVQTLRAARQDKDLWHSYVDQEIQHALFHLEIKAGVIGMSADDLFAEIEYYVSCAVKMRTPVMPVLEAIEGELDVALEQHREAKVAEATRRASTEKARASQTAGADARAERWLAEIAAKPKGRLIKVVQADIAEREGITVETVQKKIADYRKRHRQKSI